MNRKPTDKVPERGAGMGDAFDAAVRGLEGIPDTVKTQPSTRRVIQPFSGVTETFIVQTYRNERGDTVLIEHVGAAGSFRLALPPEVADTIARQRDALTDKNRSRAAQAVADDRKARGIRPAFLKGDQARVVSEALRAREEEAS